MTIIEKIRIKAQLHRPAPTYIPKDDGFNKKWENATTAEKIEVVEMYNKYYCKDGNFLNLDKAEKAFTGSRWITIKYTWGVEPF